MDIQDINLFIEPLVNAGILSESQAATEVLSESLKDWIAVLWHTEDVQDRMKERDHPRQDDSEFARKVLNSIDHDATIGINWDVIDCAVDDFNNLS